MGDPSPETCPGRACLTSSSTETQRRLRRKRGRELKLLPNPRQLLRLLTLLLLKRRNGLLMARHLLLLLLNPQHQLLLLLLLLLLLVSRLLRTGQLRLSQVTGQLNRLRPPLPIPGEAPASGDIMLEAICFVLYAMHSSCSYI